MIFSESYELYYKPKLENKTGKVIGIECQPRFKVENGITLSSNFFIENIYSTHRNYEMFLFTLQESTKHLRDINTSLCIFISVKRQDILSYDLAASIRVHCDNYGFSTSSITLQLDSSLTNESDNILFLKLNELKDAGVNIFIGQNQYSYDKRYVNYYSKIVRKLKYNLLLFKSKLLEITAI